ncbi:putative xanthine dehydrogenase subunit A [Baekduia alba]|uniref:XdhC family protein n=1 Tax=Baekduia alba TaxID=2997333 RepID=UPI0023421C33|nr:XdhC family protein [Baekduia alba]WCB96700.1 putative xanthine dehydrogenase subunit A [Baekduia alba]
MNTTQRTTEVGASWLEQGKRVVCALLIEVEGSAPLDAGASMLVAESGEIEGSITGGCVEGAVATEARNVLAGGPPRTVTYGISDQLAGTVGLTCGGTVHIFVHELSGAAGDVELAARRAIAAGRPVAVATLLDGAGAGSKLAVIDGEAVGSLRGPELLDASVTRDAAGLLAQGRTGIRRYGADGAVLGAELAVHVRSFATPPRMLIFGAIDFSAALAPLAAALGYRVTIVDPREPFIRSPRYASVAEIVVGWPQDALEGHELGPRDAILVFTHDPKLDEPALRGALATGAGYIGALGSRKTTADRNRRLLELGVREAELARVMAPCGLDIGSSTPEEAAIAILAEIVARRNGRGGEPLVGVRGAIHAHLGGDA